MGSNLSPKIARRAIVAWSCWWQTSFLSSLSASWQAINRNPVIGGQAIYVRIYQHGTESSPERPFSSCCLFLSNKLYTKQCMFEQGPTAVVITIGEKKVKQQLTQAVDFTNYALSLSIAESVTHRHHLTPSWIMPPLAILSIRLLAPALSNHVIDSAQEDHMLDLQWTLNLVSHPF